MNDIQAMINSLKEEIEMLKATKADKADLEYALAHDKEFQQMDAEMKKIEGDKQLLGYYRAFTGNFSKTMIAYFSIASGLVDTSVKSTMGSLLSSVGDISPFGSVLKIFGTALQKIEELKTNNKAKKATMFGDISTIEKICQNTARMYIIANENAIQKFNESKRDNNSFFSKIKKKVYVDEYPTPSRQLGFKDSSVVTMYVVSGQLSPDLSTKEIEKAFVKMLDEESFTAELLRQQELAVDNNQSQNNQQNGGNETKKSGCCNIF